LACASIAVPAWERICERVKLIISAAMSVSRIRLSEAERFSTATLTLLMVCSKRFWMAPSSARCVDTSVIAAWTVLLSVMSIAAIAVPASKSASAVAETSIVSALS
jgi:hypothetical protein